MLHLERASPRLVTQIYERIFSHYKKKHNRKNSRCQPPPKGQMSEPAVKGTNDRIITNYELVIIRSLVHQGNFEEFLVRARAILNMRTKVLTTNK